MTIPSEGSTESNYADELILL